VRIFSPRIPAARSIVTRSVTLCLRLEILADLGVGVGFKVMESDIGAVLDKLPKIGALISAASSTC
jgi:hypothetical protein